MPLGSGSAHPELAPGELFSRARRLRDDGKDGMCLDASPQLPPEPRPQSVDCGRERRLVRIDVATKHDKNVIIGLRVAPYEVTIPPERGGLGNEHPTRTGTRRDRWPPFLGILGNRHREMLPNQEIGHPGLDVPFGGWGSDGRTREQLPAEGQRQDQGEDEPFRRGKRSHAWRLARSPRPSKQA